jgi:hypothetical protein
MNRARLVWRWLCQPLPVSRGAALVWVAFLASSRTLSRLLAGHPAVLPWTGVALAGLLVLVTVRLAWGTRRTRRETAAAGARQLRARQTAMVRVMLRVKPRADGRPPPG